MKRWNLVDQDTTPDGKAITLHEHDGRYTIRVDDHDLMSTRQHHSEERIAELACAPLATRKKARVLIGGLGFGYTLRAALRTVGPDAKVVVADDTSFVGSFNLSRSGERNAENVVEIRDAGVADRLAAYIDEVRARYPRATPPGTEEPGGAPGPSDPAS